MSETTHTVDKPITRKDITDWSEIFRVYLLPIVITLILGTAGWFAIRSELTQSTQDNARQDVMIAQHHDEITRMKANAENLRESLKSLEYQIDRRFDEMNLRLSTISSTLQALLMDKRAEK